MNGLFYHICSYAIFSQTNGMLPKTNDKWSSTKASQHARQTVIVIWKCVPFPL